MLKNIVDIVQKSDSKYSNGTLFCKHKIDDVGVIKSLFNEGLLENDSIDQIYIGQEYELEFPIIRLQKHGFYLDFHQFVIKKRYLITDASIYIYQEQNYLEDTDFFLKYKTTVQIIEVLKSHSKHTYSTVNIENLIIVREERSLVAAINYDAQTLQSLNENKIKLMESFIELLKETNESDKRNIYLNELIEFLLVHDENIRFSKLLLDFENFSDVASKSYNFYLRNFSYNKLKLEIDSKAIEFNQKLQAVINDSQTKLIAIPAAFVLVLSGLDYDNVYSTKNFIATIGLFIFSMLLQLFLNNQKSAIKFIEENIDYYKSTFKNQDRKEVEKSFSSVNSERHKQFLRLLWIEVLLWFIPVFTLSMLLYLSNYQLLSIIILFFYTWIFSNKIMLRY